MSPIDVGGIIPPPPPPRDDDRERADRDKDRARTDRDDRFLRAVRDTADKGRERLVQHEAATKRQSEVDTAQRDAEDRRADRDRTAEQVERRPTTQPAAARDSGLPAVESETARDAASAAAPDAHGSRETAPSRASAPVKAVVGPAAAPGEDSTRPTERGGRKDHVADEDAARAAAPRDGDESGGARVEAKSNAPDPTGSFTPNAVASPPQGGGEDPKIPRGIVRQAVEFAAFAERGGTMEFSLALGAALGGATLTLTALGNKKVAIRLAQRGGAKGSIAGAAIDERDLAELVSRLAARGIGVTEITLC